MENFTPLTNQEKTKRRIKRIYFKSRTGIHKWRLLGSDIRHVVLTTSADAEVTKNPERLRQDAKELKKRIKRITPLKLINQRFLTWDDLRRYYPNKPINESLRCAYYQVRTNEGNGVLHNLFASDFIPQHWLSKQWKEIHKSPNVSIRLVTSKENKEMANYLASQMCDYISNQDATFIRQSSSHDWIYRGWSLDYKQIKNRIANYHYNPTRCPSGGWYQTYDSYAEYMKKISSPPPPQTLLFKSVEKTNKAYFIQEWNRHIENKFGDKTISSVSIERKYPKEQCLF
jgi:hypothetical protein